MRGAGSVDDSFLTTTIATAANTAAIAPMRPSSEATAPVGLTIRLMPISPSAVATCTCQRGRSSRTSQAIHGMNTGIAKFSNTASASGRRPRAKKKQYIAATPKPARVTCKPRRRVVNDTRCRPTNSGTSSATATRLRRKTMVSLGSWSAASLIRLPITANSAPAVTANAAPSRGLSSDMGGQGHLWACRKLGLLITC